MKINKIQINSFGKFNNFEIILDNNFQIIYGKNEAGKSTIMEFIKIMLYSRRNGDTTGKDDKILRAKYMPWTGTQEMSGAIEFSHNNSDYKLQKKIDLNSVSKDITDLLNISTGEFINFKKKQEVGEYLFDIDLKSFERTGYIKNLGDNGFEQSKNNIDTLTEKIINFSLTGEEEFSANTIISRLENAIKDLTRNRNKSGKIPETREKISDLSENIHNLNKLEKEQLDILDKINNIKELQKEKSFLKNKLKLIEKHRKNLLIKDLIYIKKENQKINSKLNIPDKNIINKLSSIKEDIKFYENEILDQKIELQNLNVCDNNNQKSLKNSISHRKNIFRTTSLVVFILISSVLSVNLFRTNFDIITNILALVLIIFGGFYLRKQKKELSKLQEKINIIETDILFNIKAKNQKIVQSTEILDNHKKEFVDILSNYENKGSIIDFDKALVFFNEIIMNINKIEKNNEKIEYYNKILCIEDKNISELEEIIDNYNFNEFNVTDEAIYDIKNRLEILENMNLEDLYIENHKKIKRIDTNTDKLNKKIFIYKQNLEKLENYLKSLEIAKEIFCECLDNIRKVFGPELNNQASEIFKDITGDKYNKIYVQKDYKIIINNNFFDRNYESFSSGTIDQAYLSLRIAVSKLISKNKIPLILDDVLVRYDSNRVMNTLNFFKKISKDTQIILFTCHDYIINYAKELNIKIINI